ncbi:FkbM family methyltransferase [Lachnospiraceae bacterium ZAX-1]
MKILDKFLQYNKKNIIDEVMATVKRDLLNKKLVVYGAGSRGKRMVRIFSEYGLSVTCFCDDQPNKQDIYVNDTPVLSFEDLMKQGERGEPFVLNSYAVVIATYAREDITNKLRMNNFNLNNIYFYPELLVDMVDANQWKVYERELETLSAILYDKKSKLLLEDIIEHLVTGKMEPLFCVKDDAKLEYFDLELSDHEIFVDCGAFDGDTILQFVDKVKKFKKIYAFEPDRINYNNLKINIQKWGAKIQIENMGLCNFEGEISFSEDGAVSSKVSAQGKSKVHVLKLDDYFSGKDAPTFLKMDIEGSEIAALEGAKHIIETKKPKLAVCLYHKLEHIWEIPYLLKEWNSDYQIYIRHYSANSINELICYAV